MGLLELVDPEANFVQEYENNSYKEVKKIRT